jgi:hypothetical protein
VSTRSQRRSCKDNYFVEDSIMNGASQPGARKQSCCYALVAETSADLAHFLLLDLDSWATRDATGVCPFRTQLPASSSLHRKLNGEKRETVESNQMRKLRFGNVSVSLISVSSLVPFRAWHDLASETTTMKQQVFFGRNSTTDDNACVAG